MGPTVNNEYSNFAFSLCAFNCQSFKSNVAYILSLTQSHDIVFLSEHWLSNLEHFLLDLVKTTHTTFFSFC